MGLKRMGQAQIGHGRRSDRSDAGHDASSQQFGRIGSHERNKVVHGGWRGERDRVYPGAQRYPLAERIDAVPLAALLD